MSSIKLNIKYSNQSSPITWEQIKKYHKNAPSIVLPREHHIIEKYQIHADMLFKKGIDLKDYIYNQLFEGKDIKYCLELNNYPYWCYGLKHYLLWFNPKYNNLLPTDLNKVNPDIVNNIVKTKYPNNQYIYYENLENNKSIPSIKHLHIFIKTSIETDV